VSMFNNPGNAGFNHYPPGPHSGMPADPDTRIDSDPFDRRVWMFTRSRWSALIGLALLCVVLATRIIASLPWHV